MTIANRAVLVTGANRSIRPAGLMVTLGIAGASWVVAIRQMTGMDMGVATRPGSFGFFVVLWVLMMAAMMLPGAAPVSSSGSTASARASD